VGYTWERQKTEWEEREEGIFPIRLFELVPLRRRRGLHLHPNARARRGGSKLEMRSRFSIAR